MLSAPRVSFTSSVFSDCLIGFDGAGVDGFYGEQIAFSGAVISGGIIMFGAHFVSGNIHFDAQFSDGKEQLHGAAFSASEISFDGATFCGGQVDFGSAQQVSPQPDQLDPQDGRLGVIAAQDVLST